MHNTLTQEELFNGFSGSEMFFFQRQALKKTKRIVSKAQTEKTKQNKTDSLAGWNVSGFFANK
jgi:hypothetical protein